jgi:hypothetical protein
MSNFFNPANPRFRRGVHIISIYACTFVGAGVLIGDFGTQEHVFSPAQRFLVPRIDKYFAVTKEELGPSNVTTAVTEPGISNIPERIITSIDSRLTGKK